MKLTVAQKILVADGFPANCLISAKDRAAAWEKQPPRPYGQFGDDEKTIAQKAMLEELKKEANRKRDIHLANLRARKTREKIDITGKRWNPRISQWVDDPFQNTQENDKMPKWKVTPYDAEGNVVQRGVTSINDGTSQVEVFAKMGSAYHRCATGVVKKIIVTDAAGGLIREWEEGSGAELPKPEPALDKDIKKAKAKGEQRAAKTTAKATPKAKGEPKGPGVIATILEIINREKGATIEEIMPTLIKTFPDRDPKGMTSTAKIQANRHAKSKVKDDKRGLVYYGRK